MSAPVVLVHPPWAKACEPSPGLLALAGHLRRQGVPVRLVDANLGVQEELFSGPSLAECHQRLAASGVAGHRLTSARRAARRAPAAWEALRRPETYREPATYRAALDALEEATRALSRARGGRFSLSDLELAGLSPLSSRDLERVAAEPGLLPVATELEAAADEVLGADPGVVGMSASFLSQALPAFALAGLLRRRGYRGRLVLGGGLVASWRARLVPDLPVFRVWDGLVSGPGEDALAALAHGNTDVPGLLAPSLGAWNPAAGGTSVCFVPDGAGLPWGRYPSPGPVVPLAASRGCYWRRCAFCPEAAQDRQPFRQAPVEGLREAILRARDALGATWFHLCDDAIPPALLRDLARGLRGEGVRWYGFVRLEPYLRDPAFVDDLAAGGCAMLQLGVETVSQRLLDRMGKGIHADDAAPILANLRGAGIRTYVYLLFGLPTETEDEARATVEWAATHADAITFLNLALMHLPRGSALEDDGGAGPGPSGLDLSLYREPGGTGHRDRRAVRVGLTAARQVPALRPVVNRRPPGFTSNHAAFAPLPDENLSR